MEFKSEKDTRAFAWLYQAQEDLRWGEDSLKLGHFSQTCFVAQQVAEKSLKALGYYQGFDIIKGHNLSQLSKKLNFNGDVLKAAQILDLYYSSSRYPDVLPDFGIPSLQFGIDQAGQALDLARIVFEKVKEELSGIFPHDSIKT